jgi:hypothetical protein
MRQRNLRMLKASPTAEGMCEACDARSNPTYTKAAQSEWEIRVQFERHKCKLRGAAVNTATEVIPSR